MSDLRRLKELEAGNSVLKRVYSELALENAVIQDPLQLQPGTADQNDYIERFNLSYRQGVLDAYVFGSIDEVKAITEEWPDDYNTARPHDSLGQLPPRTFLPRSNRPGESSYQLST